MKQKLSGQITVETAIVFPVVMMVIASLVCFSLYIHDVVTLKSYAYSAGISCRSEKWADFDNEIKKKMKKAPVFLLKPEVSSADRGTCFEINIYAKGTAVTSWLQKLMGKTESIQTIQIEKKMSKEILYAYSAVRDKLKEGDD